MLRYKITAGMPRLCGLLYPANLTLGCSTIFMLLLEYVSI